MRHLWSILCLLGCGFGVGCSSLGFATYPVAHFMTHQTKEVLDASPQRPQVPRELAKQVLPNHYLQPGDELLVEAVNGESEIRIPADQQVAADGSLDLGEYGRLIVASSTLEEAERVIHQTIAAIEHADVSVNVRLLQPIHRYYVVGEVNSPGAYPLTGFETVLDGIMAAGGLTSRASACDTLLARPTDPCSCRVTLPVCYRAITQLGDTTTNYQLKPGDRIFVGRQSFTEEILHSCSKQTCPRCCDQQTACCEPRFADRSGPEFWPPSTKVIAPFFAPSETDAVSLEPAFNVDREASDQKLSEIKIEPWPPMIEETDLEATESEQAPIQGRAREDGQLDFEDLPSGAAETDGQ